MNDPRYDDIKHTQRFRDEVENIAQSMYQTTKLSDGSSLPISMCWVAAFDTMLKTQGFAVVKAPSGGAEVLKFRPGHG